MYPDHIRKEDDIMFVSIQDFPMLNRDCAELHQNLIIERGNGNKTIVAKIQSS